MFLLPAARVHWLAPDRGAACSRRSGAGDRRRIDRAAFPIWLPSKNIRRWASFGAPSAMRALFAAALEGVSEVYHLAAAVGVALIAREPLQTIERNIYPTQLLLDELCRRHAAGQAVKFFLASTSEVYGKNPKPTWTEDDDLVFGSTTRPRWSYGASKAIDEFLTLACAPAVRLTGRRRAFFQCRRPATNGGLRNGIAAIRGRRTGGPAADGS